ncbi:hypothetical protein PC112_g20013 [Phytophthora cactorum]|nr:hypothetical protein PC112_g20013 [Phytophthora cactorum]
MPRRPKNKNKEKHKGATSELSAEAAKEAPNKYFAPSESTKPQYILYPELETRLLEWIRLMRQTKCLCPADGRERHALIREQHTGSVSRMAQGPRAL